MDTRSKSDENGIEPVEATAGVVYDKDYVRETHEIFQKAADGVDFRTVSWPRATIIFLKIQFAMSILAVPGALATLGAVGGALSIVGWEVLNTCEYTNGDLDTRKMD